MLIKLTELIDKYEVKITGILHIGAHECEEIHEYDKYISRDKVLWIEAIENKVIKNKMKYIDILIEQAVISDKEEDVNFNISNNGESSSLLKFGLHKIFHPHIWYIDSYKVKTVCIKDILSKYSDIKFNFINIDIQGAELKALKGMGTYLDRIEYCYLEVNDDYVYEDCALVGEIDDFLKSYNLYRVETKWNNDCKWGDAFYIKKDYNN